MPSLKTVRFLLGAYSVVLMQHYKGMKCLDHTVFVAKLKHSRFRLLPGEYHNNFGPKLVIDLKVVHQQNTSVLVSGPCSPVKLHLAPLQTRVRSNRKEE